MKSEQKTIAKELATIQHEINIHNITFDKICETLHCTLDLIENCGLAERNADGMTKKLLNQAIFEKFLVSNGEDIGTKVDFEFKSPFAEILEPMKNEICKINNAKRMKTENLKNLIKDTKNRIRNLYGCDFNVSAGLNPIYSEALPNETKIFGANSSSKDLLVEHYI